MSTEPAYGTDLSGRKSLPQISTKNLDLVLSFLQSPRTDFRFKNLMIDCRWQIDCRCVG
jgi:hypothetical protein